MNKKVILPTDPEACELVTVKMWKTSNGVYFLEKDEALARWHGSTHDTCECGDIFEKRSYTKCPKCILESKKIKYSELEKVEWDEQTPITVFYGDDWFYSWDQVNDYCDENETDIESLMLVHSEPIELPTIDTEDFLSDVMPEDGEVPEDLVHAAEEFNNAIARCATLSYARSNKAVKYSKPVEENDACSKCGHKYKALRVGKDTCCKEDRAEKFKIGKLKEENEADARNKEK